MLILQFQKLSLIVDDKTINIVIEFLIEKLETEPQEIEIFRNRLSNKNDRSLGKYFNQKYWKNEVAVQFGIESIPASFILDPAGKIIARDLRGADLGAFLIKTLK